MVYRDFPAWAYEEGDVYLNPAENATQIAISNMAAALLPNDTATVAYVEVAMTHLKAQMALLLESIADPIVPRYQNFGSALLSSYQVVFAQIDPYKCTEEGDYNAVSREAR